MKHSYSILALIAAMPAFAESSRQLDAHEHGVGALNIAIDGATVAMEFHAPGADIVGFEYEAESDADLAVIDAAIATLSMPLELFALPSAAGCEVTSVEAGLESDDHDAHDEHDDHDDHDDHDEHAEASGHTEFHAEYMLTCADPDQLTEISFAYFETFPNAKEVEVQMITGSGAVAFEVEADAPVLDLGR